MAYKPQVNSLRSLWVWATTALFVCFLDIPGLGPAAESVAAPSAARGRTRCVESQLDAAVEYRARPATHWMAANLRLGPPGRVLPMMTLAEERVGCATHREGGCVMRPGVMREDQPGRVDAPEEA